MFNAMDYPISSFLVSLTTLWISAWFGASCRRRYGNVKGGEDRDFFTIILGASLTLLGLIIAFSFSMAVSRYDQRKNYEEQEANAIGTEYVRANLLPAPDAAKVQGLLKSYLDQRILYYETRNDNELRLYPLQCPIGLRFTSAASDFPLNFANCPFHFDFIYRGY